MKRTPESLVDMDAQRWHALVERKSEADGTFVYGVRTTSVFCRPSCRSRRPRRENVSFFAAPAEARAAGYRACLRCRPEASDRAPRSRILLRACRLLERDEANSSREVAAELGLSDAYFQRMFKRELGITPQAYRRRILAERAKEELSSGAGNVTQAALSAGYASSGRFYAAAGRELGMGAREARRGARGQHVRFALRKSSLGRVLVAWTERGVCQVALAAADADLLSELSERYPDAIRTQRGAPEFVDRILAAVERPRVLDIPLDVQGTAFQERVWQALRDIPPGEQRSYGDIARSLGAVSSVRAVANACASNPVALAIPCHRVVRSDGELGGYRWGLERKQALLAREASSGRARSRAT